jgi:ubiquinol-cytochrome c reductase cytochrome c subunit
MVAGPPERSRFARALSSAMAIPAIALAAAAVMLPTWRASTAVAATQSDARVVYLRDCATCHGADGRGTDSGPTLNGQGAAGVDFMLTTGRMPLAKPSAEMKRRAPAYDPATISALDSYVAGLVPGGPSIPDVATAGADQGAGGSIYREQCAACHQAAGIGGTLLGQQSPSLLQSTPVQVAEAVRTGPGTMPVFGQAAISDADINALAAYVVALQHPPDPGGQALWHIGPLAEGGIALTAMGVVLLGLRRIGTRT